MNADVASAAVSGCQVNPSSTTGANTRRTNSAKR
jgi:hypothetical protein